MVLYNDFEAEPSSYFEIELCATKTLLDLLSKEKYMEYCKGKYSILDVVEIDFQKRFPSWSLVYVEDDNPILAGKEAGTSFKNHRIYIRESDINKIGTKKGGRTLMSLGHELGHIQMGHEVYFSESLLAARSRKHREIPVCRRGDWQAEAFGSAIVMPFEAVSCIVEQCMDKDGVLNRDICMKRIVKIFSVSKRAASKRIENFAKLKKGGKVECIKKELISMKTTPFRVTTPNTW